MCRPHGKMLEPVMPAPMLNPMHPPLAEQLMALSIRTFGDVPLGWRYPSVPLGSLAITAMYLCGLALFTAQGPAVASALLTFFNQMVFVQSRILILSFYSRPGSPGRCCRGRSDSSTIMCHRQRSRVWRWCTR